MIGLAGTLFWFLIKAMARIQMPERPGASERGRSRPSDGRSKYDCIVIGSGPGGYVAAIRAAQLGMKTAVIEKGDVGGRCLNEACIPAKAMLRVADAMKEVGARSSFGITAEGINFDFGGATKHRDKVIKTLTGGVAMLFDKNKIDYIEGLALGHRRRQREGGRLLRRHRDRGRQGDAGVRLGAAAGAGPEVRQADLDTAGMWLAGEQPKRLAVIGAGASGTEVASAFGRLGTEVVLLEALDQILPLEDKEIARACAREVAKQNVKIVTGANVEAVEDPAIA